MAAISASLPGASKNEGEKRGKKERKKRAGGGRGLFLEYRVDCAETRDGVDFGDREIEHVW
jgi:hypothetical protein